MRWTFVAVPVLAFLWLGNAAPVTAQPVDDDSLTVALSGSRPFAFTRAEATVAESAKCNDSDARFHKLDNYCGYAVDTLREALVNMCDDQPSERYCNVSLATCPLALSKPAVVNGDTSVRLVKEECADISVGNISMTSTRSQDVDFSVPIYADGGLQVLTRAEDVPPPGLVRAMLEALSSYYRLFVGVALGLIVLALVLHTAEQRPEQKGKKQQSASSFSRQWYRYHLHGMQNFLWYVSATFLGQGERHPQRWASRSLVLGLVLTGSVVLSAFNAAVTSELTSQQLTGQTQNIDAFMHKGKKVVYVSGTTGGHYAQEWIKAHPGRGVTSVAAGNFEEGVAKLRDHQGDALIYDGPTEQYYVHTSLKGEMVTTGDMFRHEHYAIAMPKATNAQPSENEFRDKLNKTLLQLNENGTLSELASKWGITPSTTAQVLKD